MVEELTVYDTQDVADLDGLMHDLSPTSFCNEVILDKVMKDENAHVYVIREDGHIITTGTLCVMHTLEFTIAGVESVVDSSTYRGKGFSKELMTSIINAAKEMKVHHMHLTSNPMREAANSLYRKMGFEEYKTNCYRLYL